MKQKKITPSEAIKSVQDAPGSMYTREDVISLLGRLHDETPPPYEFVGLDKDQINNLAREIREKIESNIGDLNASDIVDFSSAEFNLNGNEIELDGIEPNTSCLEEEVTHGIHDTIKEFFEEFGKE